MTKFNLWPANKPKHVAWCQERLDWTYEEWSRVVWTYESTFSTTGFGHRPWVHHLAEAEFHIHCIAENFQTGKDSTMAWGGLSGTIKSDLVFIPGKAKMDSAVYVETIMESYLVPFWQKCCKEYG